MGGSSLPGAGAPRLSARRQLALKKILDDEDFRATLGEFYLRKVYDRLREGAPSGGGTQASASGP